MVELRRQIGCVPAVRDMSFTVARNEVFVVMGLSGPDKSTLVCCLTRLVEPTAGEILFEGEDIRAADPARLRALPGGMQQRVGLGRAPAVDPDVLRTFRSGWCATASCWAWSTRTRTAAGSSRRQVISKVELPMARHALGLAANQGLIYVLSMVVIGGLVGGGALGYLVVAGLAQSDLHGKGLAAGIAIVVLTVLLDRFTLSAAHRADLSAKPGIGRPA